MKLQKRSQRLLAWLVPTAMAGYFLLPHHLFSLVLAAGLIEVLFQELARVLAERSLEREESQETR
jgi:hypothetical protein